RPFGEMAVASREQVSDAVSGAVQAFETVKLSPDERYRILLKAASLIEARGEALIETMTAETGFPRTDGLNEVRRCVQTLQLSADEARRIVGDMVPLSATPGLTDRIG